MMEAKLRMVNSVKPKRPVIIERSFWMTSMLLLREILQVSMRDTEAAWQALQGHAKALLEG